MVKTRDGYIALLQEKDRRLNFQYWPETIRIRNRLNYAITPFPGGKTALSEFISGDSWEMTFSLTFDVVKIRKEDLVLPFYQGIFLRDLARDSSNWFHDNLPPKERNFMPVYILHLSKDWVRTVIITELTENLSFFHEKDKKPRRAAFDLTVRQYVESPSIKPLTRKKRKKVKKGLREPKICIPQEVYERYKVMERHLTTEELVEIKERAKRGIPW